MQSIELKVFANVSVFVGVFSVIRRVGTRWERLLFGRGMPPGCDERVELTIEWRPLIRLRLSGRLIVGRGVRERPIFFTPTTAAALGKRISVAVDRGAKSWDFWAILEILLQHPAHRGMRSDLRQMQRYWRAWGKPKLQVWACTDLPDVQRRWRVLCLSTEPRGQTLTYRRARVRSRCKSRWERQWRGRRLDG